MLRVRQTIQLRLSTVATVVREVWCFCYHSIDKYYKSKQELGHTVHNIYWEEIIGDASVYCVLNIKKNPVECLGLRNWSVRHVLVESQSFDEDNHKARLYAKFLAYFLDEQILMHYDYFLDQNPSK